MKVEDELTGESWTVDSLAPGASETFETSYTVTEADILAGEVVNVATGFVTSPDPDDPNPPVDPTPDPEPTEDKKGHLTLNKVTTSTAAAEDGKYALGEIISYEITATNDGNLTLTDVKVEDELTGDSWTVDSLAPGASETFETSYTVTEADILAGEVVNVATGSVTSPDPDDPNPPVDPTPDPEPTEDKNGHLTLSKVTTSTAEAADGTYALGETITYEITATNDGNLTLTNVKVEDELTGDSWTVDSLAPGASETFETSYTVTEADILAGEVVNVATGSVTSPDPDDPNPTVDPTPDPEQTEDKNGHLTITKDAPDYPEGMSAGLGDVITYVITAENDGNLTLTDVEIEDELTGDSWSVASLQPGETVTFEAEYTVTEDDVTAGGVVNTVTGTATSPDPDAPNAPVTPGTKEIPVLPDIAGEQVTLTIRYFADGRKVFDDFTAIYTAGDEYDVTSPRLAGYTADQRRVRGTIDGDLVIDVHYTRNMYNLTITYVDQYGNQIAVPYTGRAAYGAGYSVTSPAVPGYYTTQLVVNGTMPGRDLQITVYYLPIPEEGDDTLVIDDYGTPLGLGNTNLNAGDCFE